MTMTQSDNTDSRSIGTSLRDRAAAVDPLILAAGAVIAGAAAGALLPRLDAETRLLGPIGARVNAAAGTLGSAARSAVSAEVAAVPIVGQLAADGLERLVEAVVESPAAGPETSDRSTDAADLVRADR